MDPAADRIHPGTTARRRYPPPRRPIAGRAGWQIGIGGVAGRRHLLTSSCPMRRRRRRLRRRGTGAFLSSLIAQVLLFLACLVVGIVLLGQAGRRHRGSACSSAGPSALIVVRSVGCVALHRELRHGS